MNAPLNVPINVPIGRVEPEGPAPPGAPAGAPGHCNACGTSKFCLPSGLDAGNALRFDRLAGQLSRIPKGEALYRAGQPLRSLYAVRCGFFKTRRPGPAGEQVTGFQMAGDLLGMEAVSSSIHQADAVALEDSVVCELPFAALERLFEEVPGLHRRFCHLMSAEINRDQHLMLLLGNMRAEQRLATFLVDVGSAYAARGYSAVHYQLRMSREDIGSYLGLTIESISRLLARFTRLGLISIDKRNVVLHDPARLAAMANGLAPCSPMA
jgi:CRP/FNR family transcriptional regulator